MTLSDVKAFEAASEVKLKSVGTVTRKNDGGAAVVSSKDQLGRVMLAYALKGRVACAATNHGFTLEKVLPELAKLVTQAPKPPAQALMGEVQPGVLTTVVPQSRAPFAASLSTKGLTATVDAAAAGLMSGLVSKVGNSPFAEATPSGLAVVRLRFNKSQLPQVIEEMARRWPLGRQLAEPANAIASLLTGNVLLFVHRIEVTNGLGTDELRFRAVKLVLLAETVDGGAAQTKLSALNQKQLSLRKTWLVGTSGNVAYLYNDESALNAALAAVPLVSTKQQHALEALFDPALVAKGLGQVPLLDAVQNPALAGLLAAGTELGPLLVASESVTGWVDPSANGHHRAQFTWSLRADKFTKPAAPTPAPTPDAGQDGP